MTACVHLLGEDGWSRCGMLGDAQPGVVDDYDAVTCLLCLRFELRSSLVCDCAEPDADPRRNFGECRICRRKPLALMGVQS